jgi:uncharacterized protein YxeA
MKMILIAVVAVLAMIFCGWLTFATSEDSISITIDKTEVKEDTSKAVEVGKKLVNEVSKATNDTLEHTGESIDAPVDKFTEETK